MRGGYFLKIKLSSYRRMTLLNHCRLHPTYNRIQSIFCTLSLSLYPCFCQSLHQAFRMVCYVILIFWRKCCLCAPALLIWLQCIGITIFQRPLVDYLKDLFDDLENFVIVRYNFQRLLIFCISFELCNIFELVSFTT